MSTIAVNAITDANDGNTTTINGVAPNSANVIGKNKIINGNFDFWQRGTTASYSNQSNQYLADRWLMRTTATTNVTISQQSFTVGQTDVPNNPKYFYRWDITSHTTGSGILEQRIEDVSTFAGNTCTLSFWAKCSTAQTLSNVYRQDFGTGGSTAVTTSGSSFSLTTAWQKFTVTVTLPSISGKTIAGGNDFLGLRFNVPAAVCAFDIAQVQLEAGSSATEFEHRPYGMELSLCYRYCYQINSQNTTREILGTCFGYDSDDGFGTFYVPVPMRGSVSLSANDIALWLGATVDTNTISFVLHRQPHVGSTAIPINIDNTGSPSIGTRDCLGYGFNNTSAGYLKIESEL
jgi:hypothetical protein